VDKELENGCGGYDRPYDELDCSVNASMSIFLIIGISKQGRRKHRLLNHPVALKVRSEGKWMLGWAMDPESRNLTDCWSLLEISRYVRRGLGDQAGYLRMWSMDTSQGIDG
jgi:hypothetical protein